MKKYLLSMLAVALLMFTFSSCDKDDEEVAVFELNGSSWVYNSPNGYESITITFTSNIDCVYVWAYDDGDVMDSQTTRYTYSYSEPYVELYPDDEGKAVLRGLINGSVMEVTNKSSNINIGTFYKK